MFDFELWREWLKGETEKLRDDGFAMVWKTHDGRLRNASVEGSCGNLTGSFRQYENGLVDYEVFSKQSGQFLANEAMIAVDNQNFLSVFGKFKKLLGLQS